MATSAFMACVAANGLGALCGAAARPAPMSSTGSSLYSSSGASSGSSSSSSRGSRGDSVSSTDSILSDVMNAVLSGDWDWEDLQEQCDGCREGGLNTVLWCATCNEVLCDMCACTHQRVTGHSLTRQKNGLPLDVTVPPPLAPLALPPLGQLAQQPLAKQPLAQPPLAKQPLAKQPLAQPPLAQPPLAQPPLAKQPLTQPPLAKPSLALPPPTLANLHQPSYSLPAADAPRGRSPPTRPADDAADDGPTTCDEHPGQPVLLYCETCDAPLCGQCRGHRAHALVHISVAIEASRAANVKFLADATSGAQTMRDRLGLSHEMADAVDAKAQQLTAEVRRASRLLVEGVEARERELLAQVETVRALKSGSLSLQGEVLRGLQQRYERLADALQGVLRRAETADQIHAREMASVELTQLRAARANIGPNSSSQPFEDDVVELALLRTDALLQDIACLGGVASSGYAPHTVATGAGLRRAVCGRPASFAVHVKSHLNEAVAPAGKPEAVDAVLVAPDRSVARASVEHRSDGSIAVVYTPWAEGTHAIHVTLRGRHIEGSPFPLEVRCPRSYDAVHAPTLVFGGQGSEEGQLARPWGVCCDRQGRLVVADRSNNRVQVFRPDGSLVLAFGSPGSEPGQFDRPAGVATDPLGRIVVSDKDNHRVQVFTAQGRFVRAFGEHGSKNGQFCYPWDVDVNDAGQIVVSDTRNNRIQLFSATGKFLQKFGWENAPAMWKFFDQPRGVSFTTDGYVVVTDFNNHRLIVVEPRFRNARFLGAQGDGPGEFYRPQGVTVDLDGNIIVADSRNNRVQVFHQDGTFRSIIGLPVEMDRPSGVCVMPDGTLAVVDFGNNRVLLL